MKTVSLGKHNMKSLLNRQKIIFLLCSNIHLVSFPRKNIGSVASPTQTLHLVLQESNSAKKNPSFRYIFQAISAFWHDKPVLRASFKYNNLEPCFEITEITDGWKLWFLLAKIPLCLQEWSEGSVNKDIRAR